MIKKIITTAFIAGASLSFAAVAQAEDFPATPLNHGPMMTHGMGPMGDIVNLGMMPANLVARPVLTATGAVVGAAPMAEEGAAPAMEPAMKHHRHHRHMMSKKKMMMKKKMM